ncbi:DUF221-domain-containing protein [Thozetella sp. PMI_491]|nr:DUF221-domain-containing protein [Thozetella sp. PMI_491]
MIATLAPVAIVSAVYLLIFLILRRSQRRYYAPRSYLGTLNPNQRSPELPGGFLNWVGTFWKIPDVYALQHQSLDAYLFLRFMRVLVLICFVGCCITWPVLFPVNATGGGGQQQLDMLAYSNIDNKNSAYRYFAHALVAWVYFGFIMYVITRECIFYINLRQAFLLSPLYSSRISSRTVLFTSVPAAYLDEAKLRKVFGETVKNIWITGKTEELDKLVQERDKTAFNLEKAEVKLIKLANKERQNALKKGATEHDKSDAQPEADSGSLAKRWIPDKKRPTHRTGALGLFGKKVDTINWSRQELERLIPAVESAQATYRAGDYSKAGGVFVEFRTQAEAECASQVLTHHQALHMSPRYVGIRPDEVIWKSLSIPWWQLVVRRYAVNAFICALILFWAIPVAVVGIISNVPYLETLAPFTWLKKIPDVIMGVVTGLLPSVLLSVLMSLVPVVMRLCAKLAGEPSLSRVELYTQKAYFAFQVIQVFLVATIGSSATAVADQIRQHPESATTILANNLPKAYNLYISYFIVQGLTIATGVLTQVVGFVIFSLLYKYLTGTPRAMYTKWANLSAISWGSTLPVYTNIAVIAIVYSAIAPLTLAWATIAMSLFYLAWRYNVLFVTDTSIDTRGLIYPTAIKQLFVGLYISEICLIGLFAASVAPGPLVLMVAFLVFTLLFHMSLNSALDPLLYNLPQTLLAEEEQRLLAPATNGAQAGPSSNGAHSADADAAEKGLAEGSSRAATGKKPGKLSKFLKPWVYSDYHTLRGLLPEGAAHNRSIYSEEIGRDAYYPPSITSVPPLLWIPSDGAGISKQEVAHTSKVIAITDEGCELDEKGNLVWDRDTTRPPVWNEKVIY